MNYTSVEQSKKLIELGLSSKSADMCWINGASAIGIDVPFVKSKEGEGDIPCWSITALLKLIPNGVLAHMDEDGETYWYCNTINYGEDFYDYDGHYTESPIDAIMEVIVWLIENNHANNLYFNN